MLRYVESIFLRTAGSGGFIHAYDLASAVPVACIPILDGIRVHGIAASSLGGGRLLIAAHGDRHIKVSRALYRFFSLAGALTKLHLSCRGLPSRCPADAQPFADHPACNRQFQSFSTPFKKSQVMLSDPQVLLAQRGSGTAGSNNACSAAVAAAPAGRGGGQQSLRVISELHDLRFASWVMDVGFILQASPMPVHATAPSSASFSAPDVAMVVGLADNSSEVWRLCAAPAAEAPGTAQRPRAACLLRVECSERCLLYSMHLRLPASTAGSSVSAASAGGLVPCRPATATGSGGAWLDDGAVYIAAGTIFNQVLVWRLPALDAEALAMNSGSATCAQLHNTCAAPASQHATAGAPALTPQSAAWPAALHGSRLLASPDGRIQALAARFAAVDQRLGSLEGTVGIATSHSGATPCYAASAAPPQLFSAVSNTVATPSAPCMRTVPLFRLSGHEGSIHRVKWALDSWQLASSSDDRTARLWDLQSCQRHAALFGSVSC